MRKQGARGAGAADVGHTWGQGGRKMSKARPRDRYCRSRWGFRLTPDATCLPRIKVHLHADRLHVSEQELDTDMEHAKIHVWAAVAARACASMQRARYLWLAPSTDSDSCSHLFCLRRLKRHQGTDFSSICRKEFDYGKTPSLYPPFHPLLGVHLHVLYLGFLRDVV